MKVCPHSRARVTRSTNPITWVSRVSRLSSGPITAIYTRWSPATLQTRVTLPKTTHNRVYSLQLPFGNAQNSVKVLILISLTFNIAICFDLQELRHFPGTQGHP